MSNLQVVVFGAASDGSQGDTTRQGFTKDNANVAVLNAQSFLTSFATTLTAGAALTAAAHLGKRVNVNVSTTQTFNLPSAASCGADGVILLRNLGTVAVTLAITAGSGDTIGMTTLNGLETSVFDTDGIHAWNVLVRGRGTSANETVNGNSAVVGNETVGGTLGVTGNTTLSGTLGVTGLATLAVRPTFNGNTPWDSGNLNPASPPAFGGTTANGGRFSTLGVTTTSQMTGAVNIGSAVVNSDMLTVAGVINPTSGYRTRLGISGTVANVFNIGYSAGVAYLYIDSTNVGAFAYQSDERIKQAIVDIPETDSTSRVSAMRSIEYRFKDEGIFSDDGTVHRGFSANNLYGIDPKFVSGLPDALTRDGDVQPMTVNTTAILSDVVGALKSALARISALEAK